MLLLNWCWSLALLLKVNYRGDFLLRPFYPFSLTWLFFLFKMKGRSFNTVLSCQSYVYLNIDLHCCSLGMFDSSASNTIKLRVKNTFDKDVQLMASDKQPAQGIQVRQSLPWSFYMPPVRSLPEATHEAERPCYSRGTHVFLPCVHCHAQGWQLKPLKA